MKKTPFVFVLALAAIATALAQNVETSVADLEHKWTDAAKVSNADAIAPLISDRYVNTDADGKIIDKAKTLDNAKKAKWQVNEIDDLKVTVFGNTAIATGHWHGKGTDEKGADVDENERFTDVWMKSGGKWQCVASHNSPVKM